MSVSVMSSFSDVINSFRARPSPLLRIRMKSLIADKEVSFKILLATMSKMFSEFPQTLTRQVSNMSNEYIFVFIKMINQVTI